MKTKLNLTVICLLLVSTLVASLSALIVRPTPAHAETRELFYDDGTAMAFQTYPCPSCLDYQGVYFYLPTDVPSAMVRSARFYYSPGGGGSATIKVHLLNSAKKDVVPAIPYTVSSTGWQTVVFNDAYVEGAFWVVIERYTERKSSVAYDFRVDEGHSYFDESLALNRQGEYGDFLIRATIEPIIMVCKGSKYETIQSGIDAAPEGATILVCDGTYDENVTVYKRVTIRSQHGASKTIVQTSAGDRDVFTVTASNVSLSGFTIRHISNLYSSGISIQVATGSIIFSNVIRDNNYGIYISSGSTKNILMENECTSNANGVFIDGSQNYVSGNKLHGNLAPIGSAVYVSDTATGNQLRFNTITVDPGTNPTAATGPQLYTQNAAEQLSATENWWGDASGPANAGGQGPSVGDKVLYDPWLKVAPLRVKTIAPQAANSTIDAKTETSVQVVQQGAGMPVVTVASFAQSPAAQLDTSVGKWVDVLFVDTINLDQAEIRVYFTDADLANADKTSLRLYWWNGNKWTVCSKSNVDTASGFVWAKVDPKTTPSLGEVQGTFFAVGTSKSTGFSWWLVLVVIFILLVLLIAFRLFWVLIVKGERAG